MANLITAGNATNLGTVISSDTSGVLQLQSGSTPTTALTVDANQNILINTATAQTGAKLAVTGGIQGTIQSGTVQASTSGTSIDFTSIPSWVKRITVMFSGVSTSAASVMQIQLGAGSVTTSGYLGSAGNFNNASATSVANGTSGIYLLNSGNPANIYYGHATFTTLGSNIWIASGVLGISNTTNMFVFGGGITLGGTLDRVRLTTVNGTDTFDAGSINILYEG